MAHELTVSDISPKEKKGGSIRPHSFGTLVKLPLEVRIRIWFELEKLYIRSCFARIQLCMVSTDIQEECKAVFIDKRIISLDFTSYEARPGHWPSEFPIYDQFDNRWFVSPQFDRGVCTFERGKNLGDLTELGQHLGVPVRIVLTAPKDSGEILQAWNRVRWAAHYLKACNAINLYIDLYESTERSWSEPMPSDLADHVFHQLQTVLHFVLWPLQDWGFYAWIRRITSHRGVEQNRWIQMKDFVPLASPERCDVGRAKHLRCRHWIGHLLDELDTKSAEMLRLEQMATIDARMDRLIKCRRCEDRRIATSAWAPQQRDLKLREIHECKHQWVLNRAWDEMLLFHHESTEMLEARVRQCAEKRRCSMWKRHNETMARRGSFYGRYNNMEGHRYCFAVELESVDEEIKALFQDVPEDGDPEQFSWPVKVQHFEDSWKSLHHWLVEHPSGIPHRVSPVQQIVLSDFRKRNVMHPPEVCGCKGIGWGGGWAGCLRNGACNKSFLDYGKDSDSEEETGEYFDYN